MGPNLPVPIVNSASPFRWFQILADINFSILPEALSTYRPVLPSKLEKRVTFSIPDSETDGLELETTTEDDEGFAPSLDPRVDVQQDESIISPSYHCDWIIGFTVFVIFTLMIRVITGA